MNTKLIPFVLALGFIIILGGIALALHIFQ